MIPLIGLMIAPYLIVRLLVVASDDGRPPNRFLKAFAVLSAIWVALCAIGILLQSVSGPTLPPIG